MRKGTPEYAAHRVEVMAKADEDLAWAYRAFTLEELRWDWNCNISQRSRELMVKELERRKIPMDHFNSLGRGVRRA